MQPAQGVRHKGEGEKGRTKEKERKGMNVLRQKGENAAQAASEIQWLAKWSVVEKNEPGLMRAVLEPRSLRNRRRYHQGGCCLSITLLCVCVCLCVHAVPHFLSIVLFFLASSLVSLSLSHCRKYTNLGIGGGVAEGGERRLDSCKISWPFHGLSVTRSSPYTPAQGL